MKTRHLRIDDFHRSYFKALKKRAQSYESYLGKNLKEYQRAQKIFADRNFSISSEEELLQAIKHSHITYLGDFHTFDQSSKNLQRILKFLQQNSNRQLFLGLELVYSHHQAYLDQFLAGTLREDELLQKIEYKDSWKFPWSHYKLLFTYAYEHQIPIIALNSAGTLAARDTHAAKLITKKLNEFPRSQFLILFGELHILPNKLPKKVAKRIKINIKQTIIHQNLDAVYWKLEDKKIKADIIKFNAYEYSLQNSPPWLKYESMIFWYEHLSEDPDFDINNYVLETGKLIFNNDIYDNFLFLLNKIRDSLNIRAVSNYFDNYTLFDFYSSKQVRSEIDKLHPQAVKKLYQKILVHGEVFSLPYSLSYYCSSYTITRIAYLAGIHLYKSFAIHKVKKHNAQSLFVVFFKEAVFGYLGSKILNPSRKCNMYQDYLQQSTDPHLSTKQQKIAQEIILLTDTPSHIKKVVNKNNLFENYFVAQKLAYFLAEIMSSRINEKDIKEFNKIVQQIIASDETPNSFIEIVKSITKFDYKNSKKPYF